MAATINELVELLRHARTYFFKHLHGLKDEQWDWKPYPECKNIRETLAHLIADDRAALESLQTNKEPNYAALDEQERDITKLRMLLEKSHQELCEFLLKKFASASLDAEVCIWGRKTPLAKGVPYLISEDFYHAGQVAFIRMATDPKWDYYSAIYGGSS
jgi:uncharacterized damage-inducible protein DinB